jgi:hypothetical protein
MKPSAVETSAMEAATHTGRRHGWRENADCRNGENASNSFPERVHFTPPTLVDLEIEQTDIEAVPTASYQVS